MRHLLLAAGRGRRAGGPKAWLDHEGRTLLERQLDFLRPRGRVLVSIQAEWDSRCRALAPEVRWVAVDPDAPAFASLRALLAAAGPGEWCSVHHVDMPVWEPELFAALEAKRDERYDAVVPAFEGRRGHPVLLAPRAQEALRALDPATARLDEWLRGARVREVAVRFPSVRENWNQANGARD